MKNLEKKSLKQIEVFTNAIRYWVLEIHAIVIEWSLRHDSFTFVHFNVVNRICFKLKVRFMLSMMVLCCKDSLTKQDREQQMKEQLSYQKLSISFPSI